MTELRVFYLKEKEQIDGFDPGDFDYIVVESEKDFPSIYAQLVEQGIAPGHIISRAYYDSHIQPGLFTTPADEACLSYILRQLQPATILDADLYFAAAARFTASSPVFGDLGMAQVDGWNAGHRDIFPIYGNVYDHIYAAGDELPCTPYSLLLYARYRSLAEYEEILEQTQGRSRFILFFLQADAVAARQLLASDLARWGEHICVQGTNGPILILDRQKKESARIYVVTHKEFVLPIAAPLYVPIWVGRQPRKNPDYLRDDTGDNISVLNPRLNECTALYWLWRNAGPVTYIGMVHYRRYFQKERIEGPEHMLDEASILQLLENNDVLVAEEWLMSGSVQCQLVNDLGEELFQCMNCKIEQLLAERQPDYLTAYHYVMAGYGFYRCNMFVTRWNIFDAYCQWLFSFIIDAAREVDVCGQDVYHQRAAGFFAERMLTVWLMRQPLRIKELPIWEIK